MNDSATIADIIGPIICLGIIAVFWSLLFGNTHPATGLARGRKRGAERLSWGGGPQHRTITAVLTNPHSHPYDNLPLTELHDHLFDHHFEVWNLVVEKGGPEKWRKEHAHDHGMVLR